MRKIKSFAMKSIAVSMTMMTLVGCGSQAFNEVTEGQVTNGKEGSSTIKKVEFWNDKLLYTEAGVVAAIEENMGKASGITVESVEYTDTAAFQTAIQQSIRTKDAPGLMTWWSGEQLETLIKNDLLLDLTQEWEDYYIPAGVSADIAEAFKVDGKVYATPYSVLYNVTFYNKNVYEQAGVEVPTTFDEFLEVCESIKQTGVTPIGIKNDSWASFIWFQQLVAAYEPQLYIDICNGTTPYNSPEVKEVLGVWKEMIDKGYFSNPMQIQDLEKAFVRGEIAMMIEPNTMIPGMIKNYGLVSGEDFDAFAVPSMNDDKAVVFFEATPLMVPSASEEKEGGLEILRDFYGQDVQTIMCEELGIANTSNVAVEDPTLQRILDLSKDSENYQLILRYYENTPVELRDFALNELSRFMYNSADIDQVLNNIQEVADEVFNGASN